MTSVAIFKWAMNPQDERVGSDGQIKWLAERPEAGDDDYAAVQVALAAAPDSELIGLTMASGDMAFAAARGAERTVALEGVSILAQPTEIASALANAIKDMDNVSLVTIGDSVWSPMVPSLLAAELGWPCIMAVDAVHHENDTLVVTRRFGAGTQDIAVSVPVVLAVAARREEDQKPGMKQVMQARKKPIEIQAAQVGDVSTFEAVGVHKPTAQASKLFDGADTTAAVAQLVSALQYEGVL